jgi:hypothetical protein
MSESGLGSASTERTDHSGLYDQAGNRIGRERTERDVEALARFAQEQPLATALIALGLGYLLGKML